MHTLFLQIIHFLWRKWTEYFMSRTSLLGSTALHHLNELCPFPILLFSCCFSLSFMLRPTDSHFWPQSCILMFVISPLYKHNKTKTTFGLQIYLPYDFLIHSLSNPWLANVRAPPWLSRPCLNTTEKKSNQRSGWEIGEKTITQPTSSCAWKGISFHRSVL